MGEIVALPDVRLERRAPSDGGEARIVDGLNKRIYGRGSSGLSAWLQGSNERQNAPVVEARQQAADADQNAANLIDDDRDQKSEGADAARDLLDLARSANPGAVRRDRHFRRGAIRHGDPRLSLPQTISGW